MLIGQRVVKTVISIAISISIARLFHLEPDHFAGIISMLAVQPSVYRSLHHTLSHMASAFIAAIIGITASLTLGSSSIVIALVSLLVLILHVRTRRTASLTLAVIVTVNTMGTSDQLVGNAAAYHQFLLVLIGMTVGTVVNLSFKPKHHDREEALLAKSESMLRALLYFIQIDLQQRTMTPYKPNMRLQIEEVRKYIEKGKEISQFIHEDRWLGRADKPQSESLFNAYETMLERIRDLVKALQKADLTHREAQRLVRIIGLVAHGQERAVKRGKRMPLSLLRQALKCSEASHPINREEYSQLFPFYQAYEALADYVNELIPLASSHQKQLESHAARKSRSNPHVIDGRYGRSGSPRSDLPVS